jgi:hypothetical protein
VVGEIRIHYEGDPQLKEGLHSFFGKLAFEGYSRRCRVHFIAGRGRDDAIHDFQDALESHPSSWNVFLIDSEGPDDGRLFARLRLPATCRKSVFWMVQLMESWFLADIQALKLYYGKGFRGTQLRARREVEKIPKKDVMKWLENATKATRKGKYDNKTKTDHAPRLLGLIDPALVSEACPNCRRILNAFHARLHET